MLTPVAYNILGNAATVTGLTFASGKSLTVNNILTLAGTDGSTLNIGAGGTLGSAAFTASGAYQPHTANLDTWTALAPSANGQSLVTAANYAAMRALLDLEAGTDFYSIAAADALLAAKAPLASPPLTGVPTAPTAAATTNTTQIATTAFVQQELATAVAGLLDFKGNVDASGNPNYPAALKGDTYYVNVAGKIGGASGKSVDIGDAVIAGADNAGGTEASVGSSWFVLEHNLSGALLAANNLSDVANVSAARTNLGLGTGSSPTFAGVTATTFTGALVGNASTATTLATSRNLWGQTFNGSADVTGSLTSVGDITGGASSMTITAGTGNSRTLALRTTTSAGVATTALTLGADQTVTRVAKNIYSVPVATNGRYDEIASTSFGDGVNWGWVKNAGHLTNSGQDYYDDVVSWGFNVGDTIGVPLDATKPMCWYTIENKFYNGTEFGSEAHLTIHQVGGTEARAFTYFLPHSGTTSDAAAMTQSLNVIAWKNFAGVQQAQWNLRTGVFDLTTQQTFRANVNNYAFFTQRNAANSAYLSLPYINSSDQLIFSQDVGGTVRFVGTELQIQAAGGATSSLTLIKTGTNAGTAQVFNDGNLQIVSNSGNDVTFYRTASHRFTSRDAGTNYAHINSTGLSIGTNNPTSALCFGSAAARTIQINTSATDVVGRALTVAAGSTVAGTSVNDVVGGNLTLQAGLGAGAGASSIVFQTGGVLASGKVLQTQTTRLTIDNAGLATFTGPLTVGTSNAITCGAIELGAASDTTFARVSPGVVSIEGVNIVMAGAATGSGLTMTTARLLGRTTPSTGSIEEITVGTGLNLSGGTLSATGSGGVALGDSPTWTGIHTFTPAARSSGHAPYLTVNAPTDTNLDASTEAIGVNFAGATRQHATGALIQQREYKFSSPTYSFVGSSIITQAATVYIQGPPIAGTNCTITDTYPLFVATGNTYLKGLIVDGTATILTLELGSTGTTDTTLARSAPGKATLEGKAIPLASGAFDITFAGPTAARTYTLPDADTTLSAAPKSFAAHKNGTDQTGVTGSNTYVKVTFTTEAWDIGSYYDAANSKWVPPAGKVKLVATVTFADANLVDGSAMVVSIYKNGSEFFGPIQRQSTTANETAYSVTVFDDANGTDYYEVYVSCGGASNKTIEGITSRTRFQGVTL